MQLLLLLRPLPRFLLRGKRSSREDGGRRHHGSPAGFDGDAAAGSDDAVEAACHTACRTARAHWRHVAKVWRITPAVCASTVPIFPELPEGFSLTQTAQTDDSCRARRSRRCKTSDPKNRGSCCRLLLLLCVRSDTWCRASRKAATRLFPHGVGEVVQLLQARSQCTQRRDCPKRRCGTLLRAD